MLLPALFIALTRPSWGLAQKVAFETAAEPASVALAELSKTSGTQLYPSKALKDEMLVLRFQQVDLSIAMDKIAEACSAKWVKTNEGYELVRTPDMVRDMEKRAHAKRVALIKKALGSRQKELIPYNQSTVEALHEMITKPNQNSTDEEAASHLMAQQYQQLPASRFSLRLMAAMDADMLADLPLGSRVVFSTAPTAKQRPIGASVMQLVPEYTKEQNLWSKVATLPEPEPPAEGEIRLYTSSPWGLPFGTAPIKGAPAKCLVIIRPAEFSINIEFRLVDANGMFLAREGFPQTGGSLELWDPPKENGQVKAEPKSPSIHLSVTAKQLANRAEEEWDQKQEEKPLPEELKQFLMHVGQTEPLTLFPSEPLLKSAAIQGVNVAACLDDTEFQSTITKTEPAEEVLREMETAIESSKLEDGWFVSQPPDPLHPQHADRRALGQLIRNAIRDHRVSLDSLADYSQSSVGDYYNTIASEITSDISVEDVYMSSDWEFVRLYGTLSQQERNRMASGGTLAVGAMTPTQREIVEKIVYSREANPASSETDPFIREGRAEIQTLRVVNGSLDEVSLYGSVADEPTELLARGLDPSMSLTLRRTTAPILFATSKVGDDQVSENEEDINSLALRVFEERRNTADPNAQSAPILGYRCGIRDSVVLSVSLPGKHEDAGELEDISKQRGPLLTMAQLPADIRAQIAKLVDEMIKNDGGGDLPR